MSCGRSDRVELDAFLLGQAGDAETEAFRAHYPTCSECAAAVASWMALEDAVRDVVADSESVLPGHPEPEDLAQYAERAERMGERAMQIETHLTGCARCAGELRMIRGFDPAQFATGGVAMPARVRAQAEVDGDLLGSLRALVTGLAERIRSIEWLSPAPAFALAVVILAGLWFSGALARFGDSAAERSGPQLVERAAPPEAPALPTPAPEPALQSEEQLAPQPSAEAPESLAQQPRSEPAPELIPHPAPMPPPLPGPAPAPTQLAAAAPEQRAVEAAPVRETAEEPPAPVPAPAPPGRSGSDDEILLASVDSLPPPDYAMPGGSDSVAWMRQFGAVRSAPGDAHVLARAPGDHTGLTLSSRPRLWWSLDAKTELPIQLTIVDAEAIDPIVRVELPGPHAAGLHAFDLDGQGVELVPGVDYRWFVSIVVDPDRPSRNPVSAGSLRVAGASDARRGAVSGADASLRGNKLAELGLWYDAFDFYASLAAAHPEVERLAAYRDRLAEAAGRSR